MIDDVIFTMSKSKIVERYRVKPENLKEKILEFYNASTKNDINLISSFTRYRDKDRRISGEEDAIMALIGLVHLEIISKKLNIGFMKKLFMSKDDRETISRCYDHITAALFYVSDIDGSLDEDTFKFYECWNNVYNMSQTVVT